MQQQAAQTMQVQKQLQHMQMQLAHTNQPRPSLPGGPAQPPGAPQLRNPSGPPAFLSQSSPSSLGGGGGSLLPAGAGGPGLRPPPGPDTHPGGPIAGAVAAAERASKELTMSPKTRAVYKAFSHKLRSKETLGKGMPHAEDLARRTMHELPQTVHWRIHLEMADLAKREKNFGEARRLYRLATELQPSAAQTWLEYAKMEEERGHFERCQRILTTGLHYCPYHEALMLKAIKHLERMNELPKARALLADGEPDDGGGDGDTLGFG